MIQTTGLTGFKSGFTDTTKLLDPAGRFTKIINSIIGAITIFAGLAFVFWFVIGALTWITGGHDPGQIDKAKRQMSTAIIGLIVTVAIIPITWLVSKLTGISILEFDKIINLLRPQ